MGCRWHGELASEDCRAPGGGSARKGGTKEGCAGEFTIRVGVA